MHPTDLISLLSSIILNSGPTGLSALGARSLLDQLPKLWRSAQESQSGQSNPIEALMQMAQQGQGAGQVPGAGAPPGMAGGGGGPDPGILALLQLARARGQAPSAGF